MPTTSMTLTLPTVNVTPGPAWATAVNTAFSVVGEHDHSSGNGVKITPAGMNIISDLSFQQNNATNLRTARFATQGSLVNDAADLGCISNVNGDLWWRNNAGTGVQLTTGGAINIASVGTIGGDYGQPGVPASVAYSNTTKSFTFLQASGQGAQMFTGTLNIANEANGALSVAIKAASATASYALTLPLVAPTADTVLSFDNTGQATFRTITGTAGEVIVSPSVSTHQVGLPATVTKAITFSGNNTHSGTVSFTNTETHAGTETHSGVVSFTGTTSGRGIIPLGAVIATMPHLTGAYACSATTVADASGFVQCAGQTISDASSPMNGAVIPNINDDVFLRGNVTSGSAGGSNSTITLAIANLPSHAHDYSHGHTNTFALNGTTTFAASNHTHLIPHVHMFGAGEVLSSRVTVYGRITRSSATLSFSSGSGNQSFSSERFNQVQSGSGAIVAGQPYADVLGNDNFFTAGATDDAGNAASSGANSASASVGFSGSIGGVAGDTSSVGSGTAFSVTPKYITARFVMRVK